MKQTETPARGRGFICIVVAGVGTWPIRGRPISLAAVVPRLATINQRRTIPRSAVEHQRAGMNLNAYQVVMRYMATTAPTCTR